MTVPAAACPIELSCTDPNHRRPLVTETPLYPLSEFTPEEAAKVAEFEAAPTPPEVLREQVAAAMCQSDAADGGYSWAELRELMPRSADAYLRYADAALAVFRGQQDPAVQRVLALAAAWEAGMREMGYPDGKHDGATAIRAAIGGDGR